MQYGGELCTVCALRQAVRSAVRLTWRMDGLAFAFAAAAVHRQVDEGACGQSKHASVVSSLQRGAALLFLRQDGAAD